MRRDMRERGASQGTIIFLIVVIVLGVVGVVIQLGRGGPKKVEVDTSGDRQLYCPGCKKGFVKNLTNEEYGPLFMAGANAPEKVKCPECGEKEGIAGTKCPRCGEVCPAPGAMAIAGNQGIRCTKCKALLMNLTKPDAAPAE